MHRDRGQPVYTLKIASGLVGLSPRTIRQYEAAGLIEPARTEGNQRLYSEQDVRWLGCIRDMIHQDGLTIAAIRRLLDLIPCWEIRQCYVNDALACIDHLRIPGMAYERPEPTAAPSPREQASEEPRVVIKLIYGVQELGTVMPCSRCIAAERTARRIALRYGSQVAVRKYDVTSDEAAELGVILSPTVLVNDELVAAGSGVSEQRLDKIVVRHLSVRNEGDEE